MFCPYRNYYHQLANHYVQEMFHEVEVHLSGTRAPQNVDQIYQIIERRYRPLLQQLERYNIPPAFIQLITRRIIAYTLNNAAGVPGNINRKVDVLYQNLLAADHRLVFILRLWGVPDSVIESYIKGVIRATLEQIDGGGKDTIKEERERLLEVFDTRFPNYLGLTNIYYIPRRQARDITGDIIEYTLRNIRRISPIGTIQERANQMLLLLDRERPELIEAMIRRGVPAGRAEEIARRIIIFTLRNGEL